MKPNAKIRLIGTNVEELKKVCEDIQEIAKRTDTIIKGPIPLPTKRLKVPTLKGPDGGGTPQWDRWELRLHKRVIYLQQNDRAMRQLMRVQVPESVQIGIEIPS